MQELLAQLLLVLRGAWRYRWPALALTWVLALAGWIIVATIPILPWSTYLSEFALISQRLADQSKLTLVSLPRDTVDLPLPDGTIHPGKVNAVYREEGLDTLVGMMETLYGVPIDAHVVLDMDDFESLVDAVGGVDVNPPAPLSDPAHGVDIPAGPQEIDAPTTLGYVRTRVDQDYGRMGRQQEVVMALIRRLVDPETDVDVGSLLDGLDSLETDLPIEELTTLMEVARRATDADVQTLVIQPPLITFAGDRGDGRGYILEADVEAIRAEVQALIGR